MLFDSIWPPSSARKGGFGHYTFAAAVCCSRAVAEAVRSSFSAAAFACWSRDCSACWRIWARTANGSLNLGRVLTVECLDRVSTAGPARGRQLYAAS